MSLAARLERRKGMLTALMVSNLVAVLLGIMLELPFAWTHLAAQDAVRAALTGGANVLVWNSIGSAAIIGYRRWAHE